MATARLDPVMATARVDPIIAIAGVDRVSAVAGIDRVIASGAVQVLVGGPGKGIHLRSTQGCVTKDELLDIRDRIGALCRNDGIDISVLRDGECAPGHAETRLIEADTSVDTVIAGTPMIVSWPSPELTESWPAPELIRLPRSLPVMCQRRSKIRPLGRSKSRPVCGVRLGACGHQSASTFQGALAVRPIVQLSG